jgi:hypothetical protein
MKQNKRLYACGLKHLFKSISLDFNHIDWVKYSNDGTLTTLIPKIKEYSKSFDLVVPDTSAGLASYQILFPHLRRLSPVHLRFLDSYLPEKDYIRLNLTLQSDVWAAFRTNLKEVWLPSMSVQDAVKIPEKLLNFKAQISFHKVNNASSTSDPVFMLGISGFPGYGTRPANGPPKFAASPLLAPYVNTEEHTAELIITGYKTLSFIDGFNSNPVQELGLGTPTRASENIAVLKYHHVDFTGMQGDIQSINWARVTSLVVTDCCGLSTLFNAIATFTRNISIERLVVDVRAEYERYTVDGPGSIARFLVYCNKLKELVISTQKPWVLAINALSMYSNLTTCLLDLGGKDIPDKWLSHFVEANPNLTKLAFPCWAITKTLKRGCNWDKSSEAEFKKICALLTKLRKLHSLTFAFHYAPDRVTNPDPKNLGHLRAPHALAHLVHMNLQQASADAGYGSCTIEEICFKKKDRPAYQCPDLKFRIDELPSVPIDSGQLKAKNVSPHGEQPDGVQGSHDVDTWISKVEAHHAGESCSEAED